MNLTVNCTRKLLQYLGCWRLIIIPIQVLESSRKTQNWNDTFEEKNYKFLMSSFYVFHKLVSLELHRFVSVSIKKTVTPVCALNQPNIWLLLVITYMYTAGLASDCTLGLHQQFCRRCPISKQRPVLHSLSSFQK